MAGHRSTRNAKARKAYAAKHPKKKPVKTTAVSAETAVTKTTKKGRPPIYDPERHPAWVRGLAANGMTVQQIADSMNIGKTTLNAWSNEYVEFRVALQTGRGETVARLKTSLIKAAEGYSIPLEETKIKQKGDAKTYEDGEQKFTVAYQERETVQKTVHYPPNIAAAKMMLVNLDPTWKSERQMMELTGKDGGPLPEVIQRTVIILPSNNRGPEPKVIPAQYSEVNNQKIKER